MTLKNFLVIGAYSRNAGKTGFSRQVINKYKKDIIALKVTIIKEGRDICPRGGSGCGVCTSLEKDFEISEEKDSSQNKDTSKMLDAGAVKVYWLRVRENAVIAGMEALLKGLDKSKPVICESNSLMKYINPSLFILLRAKGEEIKKKSALSVENKADLIIETTINSSNFDFSKLDFSDNGWSITS